MMKSRLIGAALVGAAMLALTGTAAAQAKNKQCDDNCTKACCAEQESKKSECGPDCTKACCAEDGNVKPAAQKDKCCGTGGECCTGEKGHKHAKGKLEAVVGEIAPGFTLVDLEGNEHTLSSYTEDGKIVVLEWFNPTCPFVKKHHETFSTMTDTYAAFEGKDVVWLAINSGNAKSRTSGTEINSEFAKEWDIAYPILLDTEGKVGKAYGAKTTPHMYVIGTDGVLAYAGAIDDNASPRKQGETNYVADAVNALLAGETVKVAETKSYGCGVKY